MCVNSCKYGGWIIGMWIIRNRRKRDKIMAAATGTVEEGKNTETGEGDYLCSEEPLTLSVHMGTRDSGVFDHEYAEFSKKQQK